MLDALSGSITPILAVIIPTVILHSSMLNIAAVGEPFRIYNLIPMRLVSYFNLQN